VLATVIVAERDQYEYAEITDLVWV
jgi:hypothetical protein